MTNEELAAAIQAGERDKVPELWEQIEKFVAQQARKVRPAGGATADDFYQCGYIAMLKAIETYGPDGGASFLSWLMYYLRSEFAYTGGWVTKRRQCEPLNTALSLDTPIPGDEDTTLEEFCGDPDSGFDDVEERAWLEQLREALETALDQIPDRQAETIRRRYFQRNELAQVGDALGISKERARQLEGQALRSLRCPDVAAPLAEFLEVRTPYYMRVGVQTFSRTNESAVEKAVILRERLEQNFNRTKVATLRERLQQQFYTEIEG